VFIQPSIWAAFFVLGTCTHELCSLQRYILNKIYGIKKQYKSPFLMKNEIILLYPKLIEMKILKIFIPALCTILLTATIQAQNVSFSQHGGFHKGFRYKKALKEAAAKLDNETQSSVKEDIKTFLSKNERNNRAKIAVLKSGIMAKKQAVPEEDLNKYIDLLLLKTNIKYDSIKRAVKADVAVRVNDVATEVEHNVDSAYHGGQLSAIDFNKYQQTQADYRTAKEDTIEARAKAYIKFLEKQKRARTTPHFFPCGSSPSTMRFYLESDTNASKFFGDNSLMYSTTSQKLSFGNETYSDYFGPIRFGVGFMITSGSSGKDTTKAQTDAIQKIISNGGNLNFSLGYPLFQYADFNIVNIKASLVATGGVDIPKDSVKVSSYGLVSNTGVNVNFYSQGFLGVIQLFYTTKASYIWGNKAFENHLSQNSFWLWQNSFGIAVKDQFRMRLDIYKSLSGDVSRKFVKDQFPVTVSFDIINPFNK
jgi:hypothetical protein